MENPQPKNAIESLNAEKQHILRTQEKKSREFYALREQKAVKWLDVAPYLKAMPIDVPAGQILTRNRRLTTEILSTLSEEEQRKYKNSKVMPVEITVKKAFTKRQRLTPKILLTLPSEEWEKFIDKDKIKQKFASLAKNINEEQLDERVEAEIQGLLFDLEKIKELEKKVTEVKSTGDTSLDNQDLFEQRTFDFYGYKLAELQKARLKIEKFKKKLSKLKKDVIFAAQAGRHELKRKKQVDYQTAIKEFTDFLSKNPEAYLLIKYEKMRNMKDAFDKYGNMVETPYVLEMMELSLNFIRQNKPFFLHGELGSGKTEFAVYLSKKILSHDYLQKWEHGNEELKIKAHPRPQVSDFKNKQQWKKSLKLWEQERMAASQPFIISGHKEIDQSQFLGGIKVEKIQKMTPEEQVKFRREYIRKYRKDYASSDSEQLDKDEVLLNKALDDFLRSPIEVAGYLGMFYKAMYEGRPVIIDEMNAIPHHILIMLNDLLNKKPGDLVKPMVDDMPAFKVQPGFAVIATGNWRPEEKNLYVGRQKLDAAYLSRWQPIDYNYLPNGLGMEAYFTVREPEEIEATDSDAEKAQKQADAELYEAEKKRVQDLFWGIEKPATKKENETDEEKQTRLASFEWYEEQIKGQRKIREGNELFQMLMLRLMNKFGGAELPEGTLKDVYKLANVARNIQNVFCGKDISKGYYMTTNVGDVSPTEMLKENVLSLRHLIPILTNWEKDGFRRTLDDYIFLYYIERSKARPEEMQYLYWTLQVQGDFFKIEHGWPDASDSSELKKLTSFNIVHRIYGVDSLTGMTESECLMDSHVEKEKYYSSIEILEIMFGILPERKLFSEPELFDTPEMLSNKEKEVAKEKELEQLMAQIKKIHLDALKDFHEREDIYSIDDIPEALEYLAEWFVDENIDQTVLDTSKLEIQEVVVTEGTQKRLVYKENLDLSSMSTINELPYVIGQIQGDLTVPANMEEGFMNDMLIIMKSDQGKQSSNEENGKYVLGKYIFAGDFDLTFENLVKNWNVWPSKIKGNLILPRAMEPEQKAEVDAFLEKEKEKKQQGRIEEVVLQGQVIYK